MAGATARGPSAPAGLLSIGQVLARLGPEFPSLTSSKLRFLEVQGIVTPLRTESGYRKFSQADLDRLRLALTLQRDHYLPLSVIREHLEDLDAGRQPVSSSTVPPSIVPAPRRYQRDELLSAAGAAPQLLNDAISTGLLPRGEAYSDQSLAVLRSLVALDRHGIEPRHVRAVKQSAERDGALIESALAPQLRRTDAASRARANELAPELARRLDEVRAVFLRSAIDRLLS